MISKLPSKLFTLAALGLFAATSSYGQESARKIAEVAESNLKPCLVVTGGIKTPTRFELRRPVRLAEALFFAGGVTDGIADFIEVVHTNTACFQSELRYPTEKDFPVPVKRETFELSALMRGAQKANPFLNPGDVVIVPVSPVFVVGNVKGPKAIDLKRGLTLTQAIELAGGVLENTRTNRIHVYRAENGKIGAIHLRFDLNDIKKRRIPDLALLAYDIVEIPSKKGHGRNLDDILRPLSFKLVAGIIE